MPGKSGSLITNPFTGRVFSPGQWPGSIFHEFVGHGRDCPSTAGWGQWGHIIGTDGTRVSHFHGPGYDTSKWTQPDGLGWPHPESDRFDDGSKWPRLGDTVSCHPGVPLARRAG